MSKFFRSANSSGSSSSETSDEETEEVSSQSLEVSRNNSQHVSNLALDALAIDRPRNGSAAQTREMLMHTLLEREARSQVLTHRRETGQSVNDKAAIDRETREQYHTLVEGLSKYNVVSHGLDDDRHAAVRQQIGKGLERMAGTSQSSAPKAVPAGTQLLLTGALHRGRVLEPGSPASLLDNVALGVSSQVRSRYIQDFEEIGLLGKGGFGEVYQVRHKLDHCIYAVKKIPIRDSTIKRIEAAGGQAALDELLAEVRSLSKLQHPNVVRYHNSWVEWTTRNTFATSSSEAHRQQSHSAVTGAEESSSINSLERIKTESDTNGNVEFTFDRSQSKQSAVASKADGETDGNASSVELTRSFTDFTNGAILTTKPTLALHLQMSVHPMTLSEFLSPPQTDSMVKPLAHCFHLEPSIRILLALLDGVEYLHSQGVVHRDLKPANIFLRHEESPKSMHGCVDLSSCPDCQQGGFFNPATLSVCIGDFGLVAQIAEPEAPPSPAVTAVGTEIYRPTSATPPASPRLDIFALGIVACELLCRFGTQMERRQTLHALRKGAFPTKFASCAGHNSANVRECVAAMLSDGAGGEIADLKRRLSDVLETSQKVDGKETQRRCST
ncbi:hypothetical protein BST61_g11388 [Cercospora zeina]